MKIYRDTKIYVMSPAGVPSGGPELLHQLASKLIRMGIDAYMYYVPPDFPEPIPPTYRKYCLRFVRNICDEPHNVLILPETQSPALYRYKNIQRVFWWLSVDNYVRSVVGIMNRFAENNPLSPMPKFFCFNGFADESIEHWVQSEYSRQFIMLNGVSESKIKRVRDYLNPTFLTRSSTIDLSAKMDLIAFNPNKGLAFTRKLMAAAPELRWYPIVNMTVEQVQELLAHAKIYIDFGNHPGRDRIPREAAVSGCVIITGRRGSAANPIDVAIDDSFKFDDTDENIPLIIERIKKIFADFIPELIKQKSYRAEILSEPEIFAREVESACDFVEPVARPQHVAVLQNITLEKNFRAFHQMTASLPNLKLDFIVDDALSNGGGAVCMIIEGGRAAENNFSQFNATPIISTKEAAFLYKEGRIEKFILYDLSEDERARVIDAVNKIGVRNDDLLSLNSPST